MLVFLLLQNYEFPVEELKNDTDHKISKKRNKLNKEKNVEIVGKHCGS